MRALAKRLAAVSAPGARRPWPDTPVPVTLVITELDVGGAEKALVRLATGLDRRRWSPNILALGPEAPLAPVLREAGLPVECLGVRARDPAKAIRKLVQALRRSRPALVQSFLFHANVATRLGVALAWPPWSGAMPWVVGGIRVAERRKRWHLTLEALTARLGTGAVCVSEGVRRFSAEVGGWPEDRLTVIPNGVDPAPFDAPPLPRASIPGLEGVPPEAFLTLYIGRLDVQKGVGTLIEAAAQVAATASAGDADWHLAMVGHGPERDRLIAQAAASPQLAGRIHWLGHRADIPALLGASDLLVLPSLWEGMPNVVLEAMAARRAVVATAVEGTVDLVTPGATGWLVPPADPDALAVALRDALGDRDRLRAYGEAARARVDAEYTPARAVAAYEHLWAGLLGLEEPRG